MGKIRNFEAMQLLPDGYFLGPYEIQGFLGLGTHAEVYKATHRRLGSVAALKILRLPAGMQWSQEVASSICRLRHPNIVSVQSVEFLGDRVVLATDFVDGKSLRAIIDDRGSLGLQEALRIGACVASALDKAQAISINGLSALEHFDLSPSEVFLEPDGTVRIKGFGLVQAMGADPVQACGAGSLAYLAPEQFDGLSSPRSDIWAVGVLLYEMMLARRPHSGVSAEESRRSILAQEFEIGPDFTGLPARIRDIILRCLRFDPEERYASAAELASELVAAGSSMDPSKCPRCGADLLPESNTCFDCVVDQLRKKLSDGRHASRRGAQIVERAKRSCRRTAIVLLLAAAAFGGYLIWQGWKPAPIGAQSPAAILRPEGPSRTRGDTPRAVSSSVPSGSEQEPSPPRMRLGASALREWEDILALEKARRGSYQDRFVRLVTFAAMYPGTAESDQAKEKLRVWEEERRAFDFAEEFEHRPGSKICAILAEWQEFLASQTTGLERACAEKRIQYWTKQVDGYTGNALLLIRSATGLPHTDMNLFGCGSPDAFFLLREGTKVVYKSRTVSDNSTPRWEEGTRIYTWPGLTMTLEIRDADFIGSKLLVRQTLVPFPVDGPYQISLDGVRIELEIQRER